MEKLLLISILLLSFSASADIRRESLDNENDDPRSDYEECMDEELDASVELSDAEETCEGLLNGLSAEEAEAIKEEYRNASGRSVSLRTSTAIEDSHIVASVPASLLVKLLTGDKSIKKVRGSGGKIKSWDEVEEEGIEPPSKTPPTDSQDADDNQKEFQAGEQSGLLLAPTSVILAALNSVSQEKIHISKDGVFTAGAFVAGGLMIFKFARSFNPPGAVALGLGIAPVAADDYCSTYRNEMGLNYYFNHLTTEQQLAEASICPELAGSILEISSGLKK